MIKMTLGGITIEVWESEVDFYKRAGYEVGVPVAPAEEAKPADEKPTAEELNAEAIEAVNTSKGTPKATKK